MRQHESSTLRAYLCVRIFLTVRCNVLLEGRVHRTICCALIWSFFLIIMYACVSCRIVLKLASEIIFNLAVREKSPSFNLLFLKENSERIQTQSGRGGNC